MQIRSVLMHLDLDMLAYLCSALIAVVETDVACDGEPSSNCVEERKMRGSHALTCAAWICLHCA